MPAMWCEIQGNLSHGVPEKEPSKVVPELGCSCSQHYKTLSVNIPIIPVDH